ncbi:MAG: tetratricopeptide repeat protein [Ghiorsea sp.]|nr:tetratricopeptide repeat protein [Ghiorsea sp.]
MSSNTTQKSTDADMLALGNFAFQQQRYDDAMQWYTKAALQGDQEAQYQLSRMYKQGQGVDKDDILALNWMKKAASNGLAKAQFMYANMLLLERGLEQDNAKEVLHWYKKSAEQTHPQAMLKLATLYFEKGNTNLYDALDWAIKAQTSPNTLKLAKVLHQKIIDTILLQARNGKKKAQYKAATMYQNGIGIEKNLEEAKRWFYQAAQQGHVDAQFQLGLCLLKDPSKTNESVQWFTKAAKHNHPQAGYALASLLVNAHIESSTATQEAWRWLYHGMRRNDPKNLYNLAVILHQGSLGLPQNDKKWQPWLTYAADNGITFAQNDIAIYHILNNIKSKKNLTWLETAAHSNDMLAQFNLGLLFARGESFHLNNEKSLYWWKLAAQNGNEKAYLMLGLLYHLGRGTGRSEQHAVDWYQKAAEAGDHDALYNLAMIYYRGGDVPQNYTKAANYLSQLAHQDDAEAQNLYASLFLHGHGVTYHPQTAITWFTRAAKAGNTHAMFNLATQYRRGHGIAQDDKKAIFWYKKAAEHNFAPAQNAIGYLYAEGRGTQKNIDEAETWFYKASENGLKIAQKKYIRFTSTRLFFLGCTASEHRHSQYCLNQQGA